MVQSSLSLKIYFALFSLVSVLELFSCYNISTKKQEQSLKKGVIIMVLNKNVQIELTDEEVFMVWREHEREIANLMLRTALKVYQEGGEISQEVTEEDLKRHMNECIIDYLAKTNDLVSEYCYKIAKDVIVSMTPEILGEKTK